MNEQILHVIVEAILFFDLSGEDVVDPDSASQQLEQIFFCLRKLPAAELAALTQFVNSEVSRRKKKGRPKREISALQAIVNDLQEC